MSAFAHVRRQSPALSAEEPRPLGLVPAEPISRPALLHSPPEPAEQAALPQAQAGEARSTLAVAPRLAANFSRVPVHGPGTGVLQAKLVVNTPGDAYEQEAERIAEQVGAPDEVRAGPRQVARCAHAAEHGMPSAPASVGRALSSPGQALAPSARSRAEDHFGRDFSGVRVHTGPAAAESCRDIAASAYTVGQHIVFAPAGLPPTRSPDSG